MNAMDRRTTELNQFNRIMQSHLQMQLRRSQALQRDGAEHEDQRVALEFEARERALQTLMSRLSIRGWSRSQQTR